jgi:hypothetical protein
MTQIVYPLRAKMTLPTTGTTSTLTFGSAVDGYQSFADAGASGKYIKYTIEDANGNWEVGTGLISSNGIQLFARANTSLQASSSSDQFGYPTPIDLSGDAVIYATTAREEQSSRQLLYSDTVTNESFWSYNWKLGTGGSFTSSATENYTKYEVLLDRLTPISDARLYLRIMYPSTSQLNSSETGSSYQGQYIETSSSTDYAAATTTSVHYLSRYTNVGGGTYEAGWSGQITLMTRTSPYTYTQLQQIHSVGGYVNSSGAPITHQAFTEYGSASRAIQGIYLYASTGNLQSGKISIYGIRDNN